MKHKHKLSQFGLAAVLALAMLMPGMSAVADTFQLGDNQWLNVDDSPDTDVCVVNDGYVALTPIHIDLTAKYAMEQVADWNVEFEA